ncbi:MAG: hypothetical protein KKH22_06350 [Proteobacteria bacterium]|nr:hypothetical protein [Pseudomonadota bacterium]
MELIVRPIATDLTYRVLFKTPLLELIKEANRITTISKILKAFQIRLNDIKFNNQAPSDDFMHFSRFYDNTFLDVSFGYEELSAKLRHPQNIEQVKTLFGRLADIISSVASNHQKMIIQRHFETEGNANLYLMSLNPTHPEKFEKFLSDTGVFYTLKIPDHELIIHITLVSSLFVNNGLFLSSEMDFLPNKYDFNTAFKTAIEYNDYIVEGLNLKIKDKL